MANKKTSLSGKLAATLAAVSALVLLAPSAAVADSTTPTGSVGLGIVVDGQIIPVDELGSWDIETPAPADPDVVTPYLIDWNQWFGCFSLNNAEDVFADYTHYWNGVPYDFQLKCGEGGERGWGYKHIRERHEADWQRKFDTGVRLNWSPSSQGIESWDDLMAQAVGTVGLWPDVRRAYDPNARDFCLIGSFAFYEEGTYANLHQFNVRIGFSRSNGRLITALPVSNSTCAARFTQQSF